MSQAIISSIFLVLCSNHLIRCAPVGADQDIHHALSPASQQSASGDSTFSRNDGINNNSSHDLSVTQKWLISSINQLKSEMNQLGLRFNEHDEEQKTKESHSQQTLAYDLAVLRADHTIMSQQQQMIIKLLKERPAATLVQVQEKVASPVELIIKEEESKRQEPGKKDEAGTSAEADQAAVRHAQRHRQHGKFDQLKLREAEFEEQSSNQIQELSAELTALHDITISIFHEIQDIEKKVNDNKSDN